MHDPDPTLTPPRPHPGPDKRAAILDAARSVIARLGLHNAPMSAVAREAGVAAGTLYLYFPSKEAMIDALYLELLGDQQRAIVPPPGEVPASARDGLWAFWSRLVRWHLEHAEASSVLHQCQASGVLSEGARRAAHTMDAAGVAQFDAAVAAGVIRPMPLPVAWALMTGPVLVLARMRDAGEIEPTDDLLRATFDGVCRSVLVDPGV